MNKQEWRKFWVITKEIYKKNVKSIGFILMLLGPIFMAVVPVAIGFLAGSTESDETVFAIISEEGAVREAFVDEQYGWEINEGIETVQEAEEAIVDEEIDGYVTIEVSEEVTATVTQVEEAMNNELILIEEVLSIYQSTLRGAEAGLTAEETSTITQPVLLAEESVRIEDGEIVEGNAMEPLMQRFFIAIMALALFMLMTMYSTSIVQEIASEKGTRIMEIILSTTSATTHFAAKLSGILLVLGTQFVVYAGVFVYGLPYIEGLNSLEGLIEGQSLTSMIQPLYGPVFMFFVLGLLIYITFSAFLGSLTNKIEDASKMLSPIQALTAVGMYGTIAMMNGMENAVMSVLSYIPFFTPFMMPMRMAQGQVGTTEVLLSVIGCVALIGFMLGISLLLYRTNVLVYSDTNVWQSLKQSWSILQSDRASKLK